MTNDRPRDKPRFAEAMTHVRHQNTVVSRLKSMSGLTPMPIGRRADGNQSGESTVIHDPVRGFLNTGGTGSVTDPNVIASSTEPSYPAAQPYPAPAPSHVATSIVQLPTEPARTASLPSIDRGEVHGEIVVMFGCRGGAGATTVAVNVAAELARTPKGCAIVDLDLQMGDLLCALDLQPTATIAEVLTEIDELDEASLRRRLTAHTSGLYALSQADRFDQLEALRPDRIPALIAGLSRQFGTVIIDGLRDFSDLAISALDMADRIVLVVPEDVAAVKNASRCLEVFRRLGYGSGKIALVVNRHDGKAKVTPAAIAATLKLQPLAVLATDARAAQDALDEGRSLLQCAPKSPLTRTMGELASRLSKESTATPSAAAPSGFMETLRALFRGREKK